MSEDRFKDAFRRIVSQTPEAPAFSDLEIPQAASPQPVAVKPWFAVAGAAALVMVLVGAVALWSGGGPDLAVPGISTTLDTTGTIPENCPVTIPTGDYVPPDTHPARPSDFRSAWYGTDGLWTVLSLDGSYLPRKSVWWSAQFPGGSEEHEPPILVFYHLLDSERPLTLSSSSGTNAQTAADGWFMIANIDTDVAGCWEVTAIYKGARLQYVYFNPTGVDPMTLGFVPDVVGMSVDDARQALQAARYEASFFDSADPSYEVCAQEPGAGLEINPGETIGMRTAPSGGCSELMNPTLGLNPDYATYEDEFGRVFYRTSCPAADVSIGGGLIAADGLPQLGQTWRDRVESLVNSNVEYFLSQPGVVSVGAVPRNGYVWSGDEVDDVVETQVVDYMVEVTIDGGYTCPSAPLSWNGIPVAFVHDPFQVTDCNDATGQGAPVVIYFHCGESDTPNMRPVARPWFASPDEADQYAALLSRVLAGPTDQEIAAGFSSFFSEETADTLISVTLDGGHLTINFTDGILVNNASTSTGSLFFLAELNANVFALAEVESVDYLVNGDCIAIWAFVQADLECHTVTRSEWEADQASWENG